MPRQTLSSPLDRQLEQPQRIVGDGGGGQALNRLLQAELELGATVHRLEQRGVGRLRGDVDPRREHLGGAGDARDHLALALRGGGGGAHGGREPALHEVADAGASAERTLVELADPFLHQPMIGAAGGKAEARGRSQRLGAARERGEARQQFAVGVHVPGLRHLGCGLRRLALHPGDLHGAGVGDGKGQQREQPVGLDLEQLLHDAAGHHRAAGLLHQYEAGEPVRARAEVGEHLHRAPRHLRGHQVGLGEDAGLGRGLDQGDMGRRQHLPRQGGEPVLRHDVERSGGEGAGIGRRGRPKHRPGGNLGVALPTEPPGPPVHDAPARVRPRLARAELAAQRRHVGAVLHDPALARQGGDPRGEQRRLCRGGGARMRLRQEPIPLGMKAPSGRRGCHVAPGPPLPNSTSPQSTKYRRRGRVTWPHGRH